MLVLARFLPSLSRRPRGYLLWGLMSVPLFAALASAKPVSVDGTALLLDGEPFLIRGAAGTSRLEILKALGANTVRTFGEDPGAVLDEAERLGLRVIVGLWLEHPRRGFDYADLGAVEAQLNRFQSKILRYRNHPALLMWGVGNEVEAELADTSQVWPAIEETAQLVKTLDPNHPTMAVIAETGEDKVRKIRDLAPSIDVLGVNSYGEALLSLPARVRQQGWTGPVVVTEIGPMGQWDAGQTPWGAAIEPTSSEKAQLLRRYLAALEPHTAGQIVFYWGQKQEVTPTWHGLFLESGEWTEAIEVMAEAWDGETPGNNRAPRIVSLELMGGPSWDRNTPGEARVAAADPDGDPLIVEWKVLAESTDLGKAGDPEAVPPDHSYAIRDAGAESAQLKGLGRGNYRVFVTVRDGRGAAATGNLPFQVR